MTPERWGEIRSRGKTRYVAFTAAGLGGLTLLGTLIFLRLSWGESLIISSISCFLEAFRASDRWQGHEETYGPAARVKQDTFEPLATAAGAAFEDLYRIYTESIAAQERKSRDQIAAMIERPDYRVFLVRRSGRIVGFSVLFVPSGEPFALLEYMAVRPEDRQGGIGAELFRRSLQAAVSIQGDVPLLVEVDSDLAGEMAINHRRILFYRRLGCRRVEGLSYILPLPGSPPEMDLMIHVPAEIDHISKRTLEDWIKVTYRDVYGCSPEDPRIAKMLEPVADPVRLS